MLKGKRILIGVSSGIAIYKVLTLISSLRKQGADVQVIMTEEAVKFVAPITFETISDNPVYVDMWIHPSKVLHIDISKDVDVFLVAPATANTIAKVNCGIADNLLTASILASKAPVVFATSMNTNMLLNPITQRNIQQLKEFGYKFIDPNAGVLACNTVGQGRLAEADEILDYIDDFLTTKDLLGKKIIVTAGATISRLDPVRFLTNDSSGKMGYFIAKEARNRGADVVYIRGRVQTPSLKRVKTIDVVDNKDLFEAILSEFDDAYSLIMSVAPVDYEFKNRAEKKLKKNEIKEVSFEVQEAQDILKHFGNNKKEQVIIGFAAETENLIENAKKKLHNKKADYIVANDVSKKGAGFNCDTNIISIVSDKRVDDYPVMPKEEVAKLIMDLLI